MKAHSAIIAIVLFPILVISACVPPPITPTPVPTQPVPISDSVPSPANISISTDAPEPALTPTLLPPPLVEVFAQSVNGIEFIFPYEEPDLISRQIDENGICVHSGVYGIQLNYNFSEGKNGGWGVHWAVPPVTHFNATGSSTLTFWVRGAAGKEIFKIGLKDTGIVETRNDEKEILLESHRYVQVSASEWKPVSIPLSHFADKEGSVNIVSVENISFGFDQASGAGSICIDDIAFK